MTTATPERVNTGKSGKTLPILGLSGFSGIALFPVLSVFTFSEGADFDQVYRFEILERTEP
jgi:hypothetical protein